MSMRFKKFVLALSMVLALGASSASSALATATESNGFWYQGSTKLSSSAGIACSGSATIKSTVAGASLWLEVGVLACPTSSIRNESSKAKGSMWLLFDQVTVVEPKGCTVFLNEFETGSLAAQVYMEGTWALLGIKPTAGGTKLATVRIEGCAAEGNYPLSGTIFGRFSNATNVSASAQLVNFSESINLFAGGSLTLGGNAASLSASPFIELTSGSTLKVNEF